MIVNQEQRRTELHSERFDSLLDKFPEKRAVELPILRGIVVGTFLSWHEIEFNEVMPISVRLPIMLLVLLCGFNPVDGTVAVKRVLSVLWANIWVFGMAECLGGLKGRYVSSWKPAAKMAMNELYYREGKSIYNEWCLKIRGLGRLLVGEIKIFMSAILIPLQIKQLFKGTS